MDPDFKDKADLLKSSTLAIFKECSLFSKNVLLMTASLESMFWIPCVNAFAPALQGGVAKELVPKYGCSPRSQKLVSFLATFFKRSASSLIYAEIFTQGDGVGLGSGLNRAERRSIAMNANM